MSNVKINPIINRAKRTIEITKKFDNASKRYGTDEYDILQNIRREYPNFKITVIKRNTRKDIYKGLTPKKIKEFIIRHDDEEKSMMKAFEDFNGKFDDELSAGSKMSIKKIREWFLEQYPEVKAYYDSLKEKSEKSA